MIGTWRRRCGRPYGIARWVGPCMGLVVMLAGLGVLVFRNDGVGGYSLLTVGAVIFGTSGVGGTRRSRRPPSVR